MKKGLKITLIVIGVLMGIIIIDTLQAKIFNNSPLLKIRETYQGGNTYYIDKGLFVIHYRCNNDSERTTWKGEKYACAYSTHDNSVSNIIISQGDVSLSIKENTLSSTGATIILTNNSKKNYAYGNPYSIEYKKDDKWYKINVEISFTMPSFQLNAGESKEFELNWKDTYGKLPTGTYRIIKGISYEDEDFYVGVEFNIDSD